MGRWEPGARERMVDAALDLFANGGFERTTAGQIADRAGVTERTFFRHFSDKREVLFDGSEHLLDAIRDAVAESPAGEAALAAAVRGMVATADLLEERREFAMRRAAAVTANAALRERELRKLAEMGETTAAALRGRGVAEPAATLAARSAVTAFEIGFGRWISAGCPVDLADCIRDAAGSLRALL